MVSDIGFVGAVEVSGAVHESAGICERYQKPEAAASRLPAPAGQSDV